MAEEQAGEKTEEATPKRTDDARKKGQLPRSKELTTAALLLSAGLGFLWAGSSVSSSMIEISRRSFGFYRTDLKDEWWLLKALGDSLSEVLISLSPLFGMLMLAAAAAPVALGGWNFSSSALAFKGERLSPLSGFKRMFGTTALMELTKSIGKFLVVGVVAWMILNNIFDELMSLGGQSLTGAIAHGMSLVIWAFIGVSSSLLLIAAIDVPFQIWNHAKELKMTKQEIKDEYKDSEGRPEVKSRIRQQQREMSQRRMMAEVPTADVIITNPEHFSVALKYEDFGERAPVVVAKGADLIAFKIREIAKAHGVAIIQAPPLARSIYFTTEINQEIPQGLYLAVAQVLAYVYRLNTYQQTGGEKPLFSDDDIPIPDDFRY